MKFASDKKLGGFINIVKDWNIKQKDLDKLEDWSKRNGMKFSSTQCKVMHFGSNCKNF